MNILVAGSSGFIGSALVSSLSAEGHTVTRLVRRGRAAQGPHIPWDPEAGTLNADDVQGAEAVVNLAGENIAGRWTARKKARIQDSRVKSTRLLSETLAQLDPPPKVLACASGMDYYGDRGVELLREESPPGANFLADVVRQWEEATEPAGRAGIRVANLRFGMVLGGHGGALAKMLPIFRIGAGGKLGSGRQYLSWVSLEDVVRAIHHVLTTESLSGPVNIAAPGTATNAEFTRTLGRVISRPTLFSVPPFALRLIFGEVASTLLSSSRVDPGKLLASGFEFHHPELEGALRSALL